MSRKDARPYAGFSTRSDHHPVIIDVSASFKKITKLSNSSEPCFVRFYSPTPQSSEDFRRMISEALPIFPLSVSSNEDMDNLWSNLVSSFHTPAEETFGIVRRGRPKCGSNPEVTVLSKQQRNLHVRICAEPNEARRNEIKKKRSAILQRIRTILREEGDRFWQSRADIADSQPDPRSYYAAIRQLRQMKAGAKPSPVALMDDNGHMISNTSWNLNKFSEYYSSIFYRDDLPCDLRSSEFADVNNQLFTVSEIAAAIMNQKSGGAVGIDDLIAEVLKAVKSVVAPWLTRFFNAIRLNNYCPDDLVCGLIVPLYKSGKPTGIPKSFRPVMLLSVVRKILTTLPTKKITPSMQNYLRDTQSGFRPQHSTADGVFYTRMV